MSKVRRIVENWQRKIMRRNRKSYTSLDSASSCRSDLDEYREAATEDEEGFVVYVGKDRRRYIVESKHVSHPLFKSFIERLSEFDSEDVRVSCEVVMFEHLLWMLENYDPRELQDESIDELLELYS